MEEADDGADEDTARPKSPYENEIIWSVGDRCLTRWCGDNKLYTGTVRKLRHAHNGRVVVLVKFVDYDSDDCEEVDVEHLQRVVGVSGGRREEKGRSGDRPEGDAGGSGLFSPLTGSEDISRLEDKYGHHESDSDCEERSDTNKWISPTPYDSRGRVSAWRVRSPVKSAACLSQRHRSPVVQLPSPRQKASPAGRKADVPTQKEHERIISSDSAYATSVDGSSRLRSSSGDGGIRNGPEQSSARHGPDDSASCLTSEGGLFEGFDEDDMEKPKFSFSAPSDKVPFCLDDSQNAQIPAALNQYLRDYQREGVQFLYDHYRHRRGAVLGDDMGLGKTVQVISFLSALMGKQGNRHDVMRQKPRFIRLMSDTPDLPDKVWRGPVLIIGPGSVLYNWLEELDTWGHFTVRKYHGADKASCLVDVERGKVEVVVTTFETCRDNIDAINKVDWDAVIVDEVHRIKGLKAQTTVALRMLKCLRRYGLTGTALQNNMSELWCILDWAQPNVLGGAEDFEDDFVRPIELGQKQNATKRELAVARKKKEEFAAVRKQMMLRRTKKVIADQLPVKRDRVVFCRLVPLQISVYNAVLAHPDLKNVLRMNQRCDCRSGLNRGCCCYKKLKSGRAPKSVMFTFMHVLLKASNHIALLIPHAKMAPDQLKQARQLCDIAFKDHPEFMELARDAAFRTLSDPKYCGKMKVLHGMLSVFAKDHSKVLVFSYSTRLLDILEQHVMSEGFEYRRIDGAVSGRRRQEIVREFNANPDIFLCLVSTKAGGLGLNMTGANKVVIFDPNWNPSHDLQAQDRAYRIGQRRDVEVYRLISAGSIEENIYLRQIYKQQLDTVAIGTENARRYFQGIQGDADNQGELFGIHNMFRLHTGDSCLTMDILSRNAQVEAGIAGHAMADYIPSWQERLSTEDSPTQGDGGSCDDSSDEDTMQAFKDLFEPSSDEEEEVKQPVTPKTSTRSSDPTPSTSGLPPARHTATAAAHSTESLHNTSRSEPKRNPPLSKPTLRQRKLRNRSDSWFNETCATEALTFLEEGEEHAGSKGKAPKRIGGRGVCEGQAPPAPAMSVVDSLVTPSFSSVSSVFEQCAVVHVHDNRRVVGGSRVEDHMTRCALHDVFELNANTQAMAAVCGPMSQEAQDTCQTPASHRKRKPGTGTRGRTPSKDHNSARTVDHGSWHLLVGQTPSAIRKKQWSQLKEFKKGQQDEITLAQQVVLASPEQRLSVLKELYKSLHHQGLHQTLDSILSKSEETRNKKAGNIVDGQTAAKTPTGSRSRTRTVKKKAGESSAGLRKTPAVRRKRKARGLLYTDQDDTQLSQEGQRSTTALDDDDVSDWGSGVSPAKVKALQNRRRGRGARSRGPPPQSGPSPSLRDSSAAAAVSHRVLPWKEADSHHSAAPPVDTEDVDRLVTELGRKQGDSGAGHRARETHQETSEEAAPPFAVTATDRTNFSVLDAIFCEPEDRQMKKRKPPPSRGCRQAEPCVRTNAALLGEDPTGTAGTSGLGGVRESHLQSDRRKRSSTSSSDIFSDLMNNSTLCDDDVDCFGEPSQWKRSHRARNPAVAHSVDRLLQKSSQDYMQLFETGRLVKKRQKEKPGDVEKNITKYTDIVDICEGQGRKESGHVDPSGSLFS